MHEIGNEIIYLETVDSTNDFAKRISKDEVRHGTVIISKSQTQGKGRLGRNWLSNKGDGIWMSIIIKPEIELQNIHIITLLAGVSVVEALNKSAGIKAKLKWPNDVIINGKKVCGILAEMVLENNTPKMLVLGIGINVSQNNFEDELSSKATSLKMITQRDIEHKIILDSLFEILNKHYNTLKDCNCVEIIDLWKVHSITIGQNIRFTENEKEFYGEAIDIKGNGALIVSLDDGSEKEIMFGEISISGIMGYI